jgi:hypothetical protein
MELDYQPEAFPHLPVAGGINDAELDSLAKMSKAALLGVWASSCYVHTTTKTLNGK